jgi:hypothetical protein
MNIRDEVSTSSYLTLLFIIAAKVTERKKVGKITERKQIQEEHLASECKTLS